MVQGQSMTGVEKALARASIERALLAGDVQEVSDRETLGRQILAKLGDQS
jgi:hypothetical protein